MRTPLHNVGAPWTPEQRQQLRDLYDNGKQLEELCRTMGRTPSAVIGQLQNMNRLQVGRNNHYYPAPEDVWCTWMEMVALNDTLRKEARDPVIVHTVCNWCELDIEGSYEEGDWRDRGNNTHCPGDTMNENAGKLHVPYREGR